MDNNKQQKNLRWRTSWLLLQALPIYIWASGNFAPLQKQTTTTKLFDQDWRTSWLLLYGTKDSPLFQSRVFIWNTLFPFTFGQFCILTIKQQQTTTNNNKQQQITTTNNNKKFFDDELDDYYCMEHARGNFASPLSNNNNK